jgi:hypothetical protein
MAAAGMLGPRLSLRVGGQVSTGLAGSRGRAGKGRGPGGERGGAISTCVPAASIRWTRGTPRKFLSMIHKRFGGKHLRPCGDGFVKQGLLGLALVPGTARSRTGRAGRHGQRGPGAGM